MAKAGIQWMNNTTIAMAIERTTRTEIDRVIGNILIIMDGVAADTMALMQEVIATTESSIVDGKPHRLYSGQMSNDVSYLEPQKTGKNSWTVSAGWVKRIQNYYLTQEYGGMSRGLAVGDREISPMHMLATGLIYARNSMILELKDLK